jgi:uncharacterized damage-inducible protein DinB
MSELATHITSITGWSEMILDRSMFDLEGAPDAVAAPGSTAEVLAQFVDQARRARTFVDRSDSELTALWSLKQGGHELFTLPRAAAFRTFVLGHIVHHRGQLSVYLRMNDVPVPAISGPTADAAK